MSQEDCWVDSRSDNEIKLIADRSRKEMGLDSRIPIDIIAALEKTSIITSKGRKRLTYVLIDEIEMSGDDANTELIENTVTIKIKNSVYNQARWGEGRARMTLAHELAHAILHPGMAKARRSGATGRSSNHKIPAHHSAEHQAKVFASAFLIRKDYACGLNDAKQISEELSVSLLAAEIFWNELQAEKDRISSADLVMKLAEEFKMQANPQKRETVSFISDLCPSCGQQKLAPIGVKYHCYNCGNTSDIFQDGDRQN